MLRALVAALAAAFALAAAGTASAGITVSAFGAFSSGQPTDAQQLYCGHGTTHLNCSFYGLPSLDPSVTEVRWGDPVSGGVNGMSGLTWAGANGTAATYDAPFQMGVLTHYNFPITNGLSSVQLTTSLSVSDGASPVLTRSVPVTVNIEETPNQTPCTYPSPVYPCADRISWTIEASDSIIPATPAGGPWVLNIVGFKADPNDTTTTDGFISQENGTNDAYLYASLDTVGGGAAQNDAYSTAAATPLTDSVSSNDQSGGVYSVVTTTAHGVLTLGPDGSFTYAPAFGFAGDDSFVYVAKYGTDLALARATITVTDSTKPSITAPPVTAEATGPGGAVVSYATPTASDPDDTAGAVTCAPAAGSLFALGSTEVDCSSTDSHGNVGTGSFIVSVADTTKPTIVCPAPVSREATSSDGAFVTPAPASYSDLVGVVSTTAPAAGYYPLGSTTVAYSASDAAGNTSSCNSTITVVDTTPPVVTAPANQTAEATGPSGAAVSYPAATASDAVGVVGGVTCTPASGSTFALGTTPVTCTAKDSSGNIGSATFTVTVKDTTAPTVTVPAAMTITTSSSSGAPVTFTASASDLVDGALPVTCSPLSGSTFAVGATIVTCTATDTHGNMGSASFKVTVQLDVAGMLNNLWLNAQGLPPGNSLPAKAKVAKNDYAAGDIAGTCSMLSAFIAEVTAQSGKHLTVAQATDLIAQAKAIRVALGC